MDLAGRIVLITGARRVGAGLALLLADRGAHVALTYLTSHARIEQVAAEVRTRGVEALTIGADLSHGDEAEGAVARVVEHFGRVDAVVNMASTYTRTPFDSLRPADFDAMIAANLAAPYHVAVAAGQRMLRQTRAGGRAGRSGGRSSWSATGRSTGRIATTSPTSSPRGG